MLASQLLQRGELQETGAAVAAALDAGLETAALWEVQAKLRLQAGDLQGTVEAMRRAIVLAPANPDTSARSPMTCCGWTAPTRRWRQRGKHFGWQRTCPGCAMPC